MSVGLRLTAKKTDSQFPVIMFCNYMRYNEQCVKLPRLTDKKLLINYRRLLYLAFAGSFQDTKCNPDEFPTSFTKGVGEGFWWSFISMTTVG